MMKVGTVKIEELTVNGKNLFRKWFKKLSQARQIRVEARLGRVRNGNFGPGRNLPRGMGELIFDDGLRIYYGKQGSKLILIICGGDKKTQRDDIKKAKQLWRECQGK